MQCGIIKNSVDMIKKWALTITQADYKMLQTLKNGPVNKTSDKHTDLIDKEEPD